MTRPERDKRRDRTRRPALLLAVVIALAVWGMGQPAAARTIVPADMANEYYKDCLGIQETRYGPKAREAFCACTAAHLQISFSMEEMVALSAGDEHRQQAMEAMISRVYAPCLDFPVRDIMRTECVARPELATFGTSRAASYCACAAETTGQWFALAGGGLMAGVLREHPGVKDPLDLAMRTDRFTREARKNLQYCIISDGPDAAPATP